MKWFFSHLLLPILFAAAGFFVGPIACVSGFISGFIANWITANIYPLHKKRLYLENCSSWKSVKSDFLWFRGYTELSGTTVGVNTSEEGCMNWIKENLEWSKSEKKTPKKKYVYTPDSQKPVSIKDDAEHVKQIAAQYNIKGGDALAKIEEIRKKTYDEPPAKPMVNPPVVTSADEHTVEFVQDGRKKGRSRKGFVKQYGEPVVQKAPKKAKARARA